MEDITQQKNAEEKLRQSEYIKSLILETMQEHLVYLDTNLKVQWSNQSALTLAGKTEEDIKGQPCYELWHKSSTVCPGCPAQKSLHSGNVETTEIQFKDQTYQVRAYPIRENGSIIGIIELGENVTERKKAEKMLQESEEKFRTFFENHSAIKLLIDPGTGKILQANKSARQFYGYDNLESLKIQDINAATNKSIDEHMKLAQSRHKNTFEFIHILSNGEKRNVEVHSTPIQIHQKEYLYSIIHDITERIEAEKELNKSEEKFEKIVNTLPQFVSYVDRNLTYKYVNQTYLDYFQLKEDQIIGKHLKSIIGEHSFNKSLRHIKQVFKGEKVNYTEHFTYKNGKEAYMEGTLIPDFDTDGTIIGYYAVLSDIGHLIETQKLLEDSRNRLRQLSDYQQDLIEKERRYIAREIHDELGQYLSAIQMGLYWLVKRIPEEEKTIQSKLEEISSLNDSTIERVKKISAEMHPQVLDDIGLKAAIEWYLVLFEKRSKIRCTLKSSKEDLVLDEKTSINLFRIFQEALNNVYQHAKADNVIVILSCQNNTLNLHIQDNGLGIREQDKIKKNSLGIVSMEERIRLLKGTLSINGTHHKGTKIKVTIPYKAKRNDQGSSSR